MKATRKLLKDLATAALGFGIMWLLVSMGEPAAPGDLFGAFLGSGIIFGWRRVGNLYTPLTFYSLVINITIRFVISVLIGLFIMVYTLIFDFVNVIREYRAAHAC